LWVSMRGYGRGDGGETDLFGGGRVPKSDLRVECYGQVDELSSVLGVCRAMLEGKYIDTAALLRRVQEDLFRIAAELASREPGRLGIQLISESDVSFLEQKIEQLENTLPMLRHFIYPGGSVQGGMLHLARAIARRVERRVVALSRAERVNPEILRYLNRLSTLLFHLARRVNIQEGVGEEVWRGRGVD